MSCASSKESKEERCKKRFSKKYSIERNTDSSYVFKMAGTSLNFPKNWNVYPNCYAVLNSPQKNLKMDSINGNHKVSIQLIKKKVSLGYNRVKGIMSKDSIHFYNAYWNSELPKSWNSKKKIFEGKSNLGKYFLTDTEYTVKSNKTKIIEMVYLKDDFIYAIRYSANNSYIQKYYKEALKIFDSFEILND